MKSFHRRDRVALIGLRLMMGGLALDAGIKLMSTAWGKRELTAVLEHWSQQSVVAPEIVTALQLALPHTGMLAQLIIGVHLLSGLLLLLGVLSRTSALVLALIYVVPSIVAPAAIPMLICCVCFALSLSDAGTQFSLQRLGASTQANHQSTEST